MDTNRCCHRGRRSRRLLVASFIVAVGVSLPPSLSLGDPPRPAGSPPVRTLQPGDVVLVEVFPNSRGWFAIPVQPDARFYFPVLGEVNTKGKTLPELRDLIQQALGKELKRFILTVGVLPKEDPAPAARDPESVLVLGAASRPVVVLLRDRLTPGDAIDLVSGTIRLPPDLDPRRVTLVHANGTLETVTRPREVHQEPLLHAGDILWIPPKQSPPAGVP
jgi:protein involved in polysaccharide export with SLBB domain